MKNFEKKHETLIRVNNSIYFFHFTSSFEYLEYYQPKIKKNVLLMIVNKINI